MTQSPVDQLIHWFSKLPGLGPRSARRAVLFLMKKGPLFLEPFAEAILALARSVRTCTLCGNIDSSNPCHICKDPLRDNSLICVVENVGDVWAIERSRVYKGKYHVLGGTLSALEGRNPEALNFLSLFERLKRDSIQEVIIATNATLEGQTTSHYLTERLQEYNIPVSRIAQGIPMGGELDYLDEGTLFAALEARHRI